MTTDPSAALETIEYEALVLRRHLTDLPGHSRRREGTLDQSAYTLLSLLDLGGPASISELTTITNLDASTLNRQTAALLRSDYAERIPDPSGGIARKFRITKHGKKMLEDERAASTTALERIIGDWSREDRENFARLLKRMNQAVEGQTGRHWPRPA